MTNLKFYVLQKDLGSLFGITGQAICLQAQKSGIESFKVGNTAAFSPSAARQLMTLRGFSFPKQILSFQMLKGGSTKTSCAFNLGIRLNQYGARVLFIDSDGQGNLTSALGYDVKGTEPVLYHLIEGSASLENAIVPVNDSLDLIPSDFDNAALDFLLTTKRINLQRVIANLIEPIRDRYDFVIFDCNPALSSLNVGIALASDKVIIPVNPDNFSQRGLEKTIEEFDRISKEYRSPINYQLLFTLHDAREMTSRKYLLEYLNKYTDKIFSSVIRRNADVKNAIDQKKSIFDMKRAVAREDFENLACEVLGIATLAERHAHA